MKLIEQYARSLQPKQRKMLLENAALIDITPVAQWFYETEERSVFDIGKDTPILLPPWELTWMEYRIPSRLVGSPEGLDRHPLAGRQAAALIERVTLPEEIVASDPMVTLSRQIGIPNFDAVFSSPNLNSRRSLLAQYIAEDRAPEYVVKLNTMWDTPRGIFTLGKTLLYLDEQGNNLLGLEAQFSPIANGAPIEDVDFWVYAFAITFLHCKNIEVIDAAGLPPKVIAKREKDGRPVVKFKTLVVEPLRKQVRISSENETVESELKRALHIARGHFKDYRDGGGLFGQHHGIYWWEMHLRGDSDHGMIIKDYKVDNRGEKPKFDD